MFFFFPNTLHTCIREPLGNNSNHSKASNRELQPSRGPQERGRKQVSKRYTHARPGMHMQQCSAVPCDHWYDTYVLPYNPLHLMALFCQHRVFVCYKTEKGTLMLLSFTRVTLRLLALLGQVTWTGTVCFRGRKWGRGTTSGTKAAYSPLSGLAGCEGAGGPASIVKRSGHDIAFLRSESTCAGFWAMYCCGCAAGCSPEDGSSNPLRQAEEEYEEDMRHPAAGGTSDEGHCCRCAVPGALLLYYMMTYLTRKEGGGRARAPLAAHTRPKRALVTGLQI